MDLPKTFSGFTHWVLIGFGGAIIALLVAYVFPAVIPKQATATQL